MKTNRRDFLAGIGSLGAGLILGGYANADGMSQKEKEAKDREVTATEDLMREHGVLRRVLFVYSETAIKLQKNQVVVPDAIQRAARLFHIFGEEYHEKKLEEAYIFPEDKKANGQAAILPDILIVQHNRGREITDYILSVTQGVKIGTGDAEQLAQAMGSLVRMYRPHAAREDTIVFPAWKETLTAKQLDEMNDKFEEIEHQQFGEDGFENAVRQITDIESELGIADLTQFTPSALLMPLSKKQS